MHRWLLQSPKEEPWNNIGASTSSQESAMMTRGVLEIESRCSLTLVTCGSVVTSEKEK
jgi:hypothetical protein